MRARFTVLVGLAALLALVAGAAEAESRLQCNEKNECLLFPSELRLAPTGELVPWSQDVTIAAARPNFNHDRQPYLNVTGPSTGAKAEVILLGFDRADFPPNASIQYATINLYLNCAYYGACNGAENPQRTAALDRVLTAREIILPWDEGTVTWSSLAGLYYLNTTAFAGKAARGTCDDGDFEPSPLKGTEFPYQRCFDVSFSARLWLAGNGTRHGWAILDEGLSCPATSGDCRNQFVSSAARFADGSPYVSESFCKDPQYVYQTRGQGGQNRTEAKGIENQVDHYCWPTLAVVIDRQVPSISNVTVSYNGSKRQLFDERPWWVRGTPKISNAVKVNFSIEVVDPVGSIQEVRLEVRNKTGTLFLSETFKDRRLLSAASVAGGAKGERWVYWRNAVLAVPPGDYFVKYVVQDNDLNVAEAGSEETNLIVIAAPPVVSNVVLAGKSPYAQHATINLTASVRFTDERQVVDAVLGYANSTAGHRLVVPLRHLERVPQSEGGGARYFFERPWTIPGNWTLTIFANDTLGNAARRVTFFNVTDVTPPVVTPIAVTGTVFRVDHHATEAGSRLSFSASVRDDTNVSVNITFKGTRATRSLAMTRGAGDLWGLSLDDLAPDTYSVTVDGRDVDRNLGRSPALTLRVESQQPPTFQDLSPAPGGWSNATPTVSLRVSDLTLNRSTIRTYSKVKSAEFEGVFEEALPTFAGSASDTIVTLPPLRFFRGDEISIRIVANDTLGGHAVREWSFVVDGRAPSANLAVGEPQRDVGAAVAVVNATPFSLAASDAESGLARIEWQVESLDEGGATSAWQIYRGPFALANTPVTRGTGVYAVRYRAVDAVGNVGGGGEIRAILDASPPTVAHRVENGRLIVSVSDRGAGVASVVVLMSREGSFWEEQSTPVIDPSGQTYSIPFPVVKRGASVLYTIRAEDRLGLVIDVGSREAPVKWVSPNQPPKVTTRGLANNSEVKGVVTLGWTASDLDGDVLSMGVTARPMTLTTGTSLYEGADLKGEIRWDTTKTPDGRYVVLVRATDGLASSAAYHLVDVNNTGLGVGGLALPSGRVEFLEEIPFRVTLLRPVTSAHVLVFRDDGGLVAELPLHDDGVNGDARAGDGEWTAVWTPDVTGAFSIGFRILYEDQGTVENAGASRIEVASSLANTVQRNLPWIVLGGLLVVLLGIAVVVQLMRYGYL